MLNFFHIVLYQPLYNLLMFLAWLIPGHSMFWAIIAITIIIRLILLPQSLKAAHLQVKNLELQPKINKLRSEIKDQQEQSKALMALYKEEKFSPFSSCLPLLIQLPILWVLFAVFRSGLSGNGSADLYHFIPKIDSVNTHFLIFDLTKPDPYWILPIIAAGVQIILSFMMMPKKDKTAKELEDKAAIQNDPSALMNKQMLYLPAAMTLFFGRSMPVGLVVYWIITTLFSLVQQYYVNKNIKSQVPTEPQLIISSQPKSIEAEPVKKAGKSDFMTKMVNKRLDQAEKKAAVTVKVREKKK